MTLKPSANSQGGRAVGESSARVARLLPRLALIVVLLCALFIRLDFISSGYYFKDDHGTAALMSLHILQGRETPLYFYGYHYVAALGAYVGALMYALFGVSPASLCLAMVLFTLLWVFATYLLFSRLVGRWGGVVAASLVAFAPFTVMWYSVVPLLGYPTTFAFGTLILYLGVRINERPLSSRAESWCLVGLAAIAGIAIWNNPLCASYLIIGFGLLVVHIVRSRSRRALLVKLAVAFVVLLAALTPVIVTAVQQGLGALFGFRAHRSELVESNAELVRTYYVGNMLFNASPEQGAVRWVAIAAYALPAVGFVVAFVVGVVVAIRRKRSPLLKATLVPLLFLVVFLVLFVPSPMAATRGPRFFVPVYIGVCAIFAFPFALRKRWAWIPAVGLAGIVIGHNIVTHFDVGYGEGSGAGERRMADMRALVEDVGAAGLKHVMIDDLEGHPLTFVAREQPIFAHSYKERYYPYAVAAAADDKTAIAKPHGGIPVFKETLRSLGVTAAEPIVGARQAVFYDFVLPTETLQVVEAVTVSVAGGASVSGQADWLIDRNEETTVGGRFDEGTALIVDFGGEVELSGMRLVAANEWEYPVGWKLSGQLGELVDDAAWFEVEHVGAREAPAYICGNRLYHRGHFTAMECRFPAKRLRYLKIDDLRPALGRLEKWRLQEAYFYTHADDSGRPDAREAAEIAHALLMDDGITLAVCDEWLSRKIELLPPPRPAVLPHYDGLHPHSHVSHILPIRRGVAVVVEKGHAEQCRELMREMTGNEVEVSRREFRHYTALVIEKAPAAYEAFPGLKWSGFTLVGSARIATAAWYHDRGRQLERRGRADEAMAYFARASATFPGIPGNLERLTPHDEKAAARLKALTPEFAWRCEFSRGISLVGYTLVPSTLVAGERATLRLVWELEGTMPHDYLPVFVHFLDDARRGGRWTIRFQADHNVAFPVVRGATIPRCLVLDEHEFIVPADCPPGRLAIHLGALVWGNQSERLRPRAKLPTRDRAVEVGHVEVKPAP